MVTYANPKGSAAESGRQIAPRKVIVLDRVIKLMPSGHQLPLLFGPLTCFLPADRVVAVMGREETGRTTFLRLLGGFERPDSGGVVSRVKFSMVLNASGYLHNGLTVVENVGILARMHGMNADQFLRLAVSLPFIDPAMWYMTVGDLERSARRSLELGIAALLPYECYLIDDIEKVEAKMLSPVITFLRSRDAGVIFTSYKTRYARQYADCAAVISNRNLSVFESVKEAEKFYDR